MTIEYRTQISINTFLADYLKFGIRNRTVAIKALMEGWEDLPYHDQILRAGKLLLEYGGAIEELFAFAYAAFKQCNQDEASVFLTYLFEYKHKDVYDFIQNNNFQESFYELYKLPEPHLLARKFRMTPEPLLNLVVEIGKLIEDIKTDYFQSGFKDIFNKLKHPFLVISPENYPENTKYILPVMTRPKNVSDIATVYPVEVNLERLTSYFENVKHISLIIETLIKLFQYKSDIMYKK